MHVLQHIAVDGCVLWHLGADVIEFNFLLVSSDGNVAPPIGDDTLLQAGAVEPAAQAEDTPKVPLQLSGGFVLEGLAHYLLFHSALFCLIGTKAARARTSGASQRSPHRAA